MRYDEAKPGTALPPQEFQVQRVDLVRYAGASGDFNVIHWNERKATAAGLPDVIAHGMFSMAQAARVITDWMGDVGHVESYGVRFSAPVIVPDDDTGTLLLVSGVVSEQLPDCRVVVELTATMDGATVLSQARAVVRLA